MNLDSLRAARYREPFLPFVIRLTDGRHIEINDWAAISITKWRVLVANPDHSITIIEPNQIEAVEYPSEVS